MEATKPVEKGFSFLTSVAFTLNYIMGAGFLTLPWACYEAGFGLGILVLVFICAISILAAFFLLEAIARGQTLEEYSERKQDQYNEYHSISESPNSSQTMTDLKRISLDKNTYILNDLKIEMPELCELFLGITSKRIYTTLLAIYMYGTLWCYSTVFANAFSSHIPLGSSSYYIYLLIFGSLVIPSTCMELDEQVFFQLLLAYGRVLLIFLMLSTIFLSYINDSFNLFPTELQISQISTSSSTLNTNLFNIKNIYILLPVAMYASIFHHSIPALSEPVKNKQNLGYIYTVTLIFCCLTYTSISIVISNYFGPNTNSSSNLNWASYGSNLSSTSNSNSNTNPISTNIIHIIGRIISFYIVLFPALDVASAFPLNGITLGNNLMSTFYGQNIHLIESSRGHRIYFRVLAATPSIIAAVFIRDLGELIDFTGLTGFAIALIYPALLSMYSRKRMKSLNLPSETYYSSIFTSDFVAMFVLSFGIFLIIFVFISLIMF